MSMPFRLDFLCTPCIHRMRSRTACSSAWDDLDTSGLKLFRFFSDTTALCPIISVCSESKAAQKSHKSYISFAGKHSAVMKVEIDSQRDQQTI